MKLLFIQPPLGDGTTKMPLNQRLFPWGLATVARCLEDDGHQIKVLDIYAQDMIKGEVQEFLDQESFDAACISGFSSITYLYVLWLAQEIKQRRSVPVVVGGLLADLHYELLLTHPTVDICVLGEGELTAVDLFRRLDRLDQVPGIAYREQGRIGLNPPRDLIRDLDALPMPNFDLWDMKRYTQVKLYAHDQSTSFGRYDDAPSVDLDTLRPNMTFLSGRGCPYKCRFCSRSYSSLRLKSVGRLVEEITDLRDRYGLRSIHFSDELLLVNKKRILEFCGEMKKLGLYWDGQARVNTVDEESMRAMKESNCLSLGLGIESGSDKMLKAMHKGVTRQQNLDALRAAKKVGLHLKIQLMGGYPGETKATLAETASLLRQAKLPPRRLNWCTPLPGSELYEQVRAQGLVGDEEAYIIKLHKGYNNPENIVLNVSGQGDAEMIRLLKWVTMRMDQDYLLTMLEAGGALGRPAFWQHLKHTLDETASFHLPWLRQWGPLRAAARLLVAGLEKGFRLAGRGGR